MTILAPGCRKPVHNLSGLKNIHIFLTSAKVQWDVSVWRWLYSIWSLRDPRLLSCGSCFSSGLKAFSSSLWVGNKERGKHIYFLSTQTPKGHTSFDHILFMKISCTATLDARKLWHSPSRTAAIQQQADTMLLGWSAGLSVHSQTCSPFSLHCPSIIKGPSGRLSANASV